MLIKKRLIGVLVVVFLLALNVSAVFAAAPAPVIIVVDELLGSTEEFVASGAAVDNGLICAEGSVADISARTNDPKGPYRIIWALKRFYCGDDTFDVEMVVRLDLITHNTTARWRIVAGTGEYADLRGQGSLVGISNSPAPGILDTYYGSLR